jgi:hypothetical protein
MKTTFSTTVQLEEGKNATGLQVPAESVAALGTGKRPKVKVDINGYAYRSTIAAYGDVFMLPLSAEHREAAGIKAGDQVKVTLELDLEPRTVEVPQDLALALSKKAGASAAFDALSYTMPRYVRQVESAKAQDETGGCRWNESGGGQIFYRGTALEALHEGEKR